MPSFPGEDIRVDTNEFLDACTVKEIKKVIEWLVENEDISASELEPTVKPTHLLHEQIFIEKMEKLKDMYYSLSIEDEETIRRIFEKHI